MYNTTQTSEDFFKVNRAEWREKVIYQIYPRSFSDSNGDGIGDIRGIIDKLDYIKSLGVGAIWLSPVYKSPNADNGYDISDYKDINPEFGTLDDMQELIDKAREKDIDIVMDLVINHTSSEHEWFKKSVKREGKYADYYIWRKGKGKNGKKPPNNWSSFFTGSAWKFNDERGEYYLHMFDYRQPDLNWHNKDVMDEIKDILRFWLERGVAGFRCDVINILYKTSLANGKRHLALTGKEHYLTQDGCHKILHELRTQVLDKYNAYTVGETTMVDIADSALLTDTSRAELDMVFSFEHMETDTINNPWFKTKFKPEKLIRSLDKWQTKLKWNTLYFENHDQPRAVTRFGNNSPDAAKALIGLLLTLRGTPFIYEGQEIGMENFDITSMDQIDDCSSRMVYSLMKKFHFPKKLRWNIIKASSRDNARTPMQWSVEPNAGFTTAAKPWLKVNENYNRINVAAEQENPHGVLNFTRKAITIRNQTECLVYGSYTRLKSKSGVFAFEREFNGEKYAAIANLNKRAAKCPSISNGRILLSNFEIDSLPERLKPYEFILLKYD